MNKVEESKVKVMDSESEKLYKRYVALKALKKQLEELYKELEEYKDEDVE